jgi:hypothetical protein
MEEITSIIKWRTIQQTNNDGLDILLLHDADNWDVDGHGAGILSFKSQMKLIPEYWSNVASEGKLGRRHPDSKWKRRWWSKQVKFNCIK